MVVLCSIGLQRGFLHFFTDQFLQLHFSRSPSGNFIATGCGDDAVRIFRVDVGASDVSLSLLATIDAAHTEDVNSVAWNPCHPDLLASASDDGSVKIWDVGAIIGA